MCLEGENLASQDGFAGNSSSNRHYITPVLQEGRQSQLRVPDCDPELLTPVSALDASGIVHIEEPISFVSTSFIPQAVPSGWEELKELLTELSFPAWIEQEGAGVIFANRCETFTYKLGERAQREIRNVLASELRAEPVRVRDKRAQWIEVSASKHPIPLPAESATLIPSIVMYVVCLPGQELQRDRAVIEALLRCLLGGSVPDALSSLTPQQRIIYRLLMSNHTYKEIAGHLGVAHATVRVQIAAMRKRLGADMIPFLRQA